ncbi:hypothetical protein PR202_gb29385 [Eleusine coracana subsp. coracana]|uniref:Protein FAR1-RELATED SEQUENCE n=1 Tax=Eleusine coracana subsp. coracana TaxID=191504 RepID=A0AAV5FZA3_ELECO|nr:hypothetical protein PR202_gb29385 [Eleusine coracana subsp. coracana]
MVIAHAVAAHLALPRDGAYGLVMPSLLVQPHLLPAVGSLRRPRTKSRSPYPGLRRLCRWPAPPACLASATFMAGWNLRNMESEGSAIVNEDVLNGVRNMASPVSINISNDAPQPTPVTTACVISSTPDAPIPAVPVSFSPAWLEDSMRYRVMITPPTPITPEQLITPEVEPTYAHDPRIGPKYVPHSDMTFESLDEVYNFYAMYAMLAGFLVRKGRKRNGKRGQEYECSFKGNHRGSPRADRKRDKTTMRKRCKAMVCALQSKDEGVVHFKRIVLEHNHIFTCSPRMVKSMRAHKNKDPALTTMIDMLLNNKIRHVKVMSILRKTVGGCESLNVTEKDVQNRWHMLRKYKDPLKQLYNVHPTLCDKLTSVINHPLNPAKFERAWTYMLNEFKIHDNAVMGSLFNTRKMWIAAFYKNIFCGIMSSTQRSESVNALVKGGYIDNSTPIHEFIKQFLEMLQHMYENEARERYNSQSEPVTVTYHPFEQQLSKIYSRNVFKEFKKTQKRSTKFTIHPNPEKTGYYFIKHRPVDTTFPWIQHEFSVKAVIDVEESENSVFNCECMNWEHKATCDRVSRMESEGVTKKPRGRPRGSGSGRGTTREGGSANERVHDMDVEMQRRTRRAMMKNIRGGGIAGSSTCYGVNDDYYSEYSAGDDGAEYASMSDD